MNPALVTPSTFVLGFLSGFLVRKYWFLIRTILGLKRSRTPKENATASGASLKSTGEESENFETDSSESSNLVCN